MLRNSKLAVGLVLAWLLIAPPIRAQESSMDDLKKEIQSLNQTIKQMQKDLQEIKALLKAGQQPTRAAPPQKVLLELDDNPSQGDRAAKLTLIEFSDYQ
jgi:Tfp pilus assembly protein PilN